MAYYVKYKFIKSKKKVGYFWSGFLFKISQLDDRFVYEIYYFPDARYSNQSDVLDLLDKLQPNAIINSSMNSSKWKIVDQTIKNNGYNHIYIN